MLKSIDGLVIGCLTVLKYSRSENTSPRFKHYYICRCQCGSEREYLRESLLRRDMKSCGCLNHRLGISNPNYKGVGDVSSKYWSHIMRQAKKRNLDVTITANDIWNLFLLQNRKCALSGVPIDLKYTSKDQQEKTASLDRINPQLGYTLDNVQWVHKVVNKMKWDLKNENFITLCKQINQHEINKNS